MYYEGKIGAKDVIRRQGSAGRCLVAACFSSSHFLFGAALGNMPAFVPIMFELTVFFAAHLMVITFYLRSRMWPFKKAENPDPRTTDDMFLMEKAINHNEADLTNLLKETGAVEINIVDKDEDAH